MGKFRYLEIESRVVYEYDHVRLPFHDVLLAGFNIFHDGKALQKHFQISHHGSVTVIPHKAGATLMLLVNTVHERSAPETHIGLRILCIQSPHEIAPMKVSRRFACNDVVFHNKISRLRSK